MLNQLDEDLRHGRQTRDQQAIADVMIWLLLHFSSVDAYVGVRAKAGVKIRYIQRE
jgi:hypothetical protein